MDVPEGPQSMVGREFVDSSGNLMRITAVEGEVEIVPGVVGPGSITVEGVITTPKSRKEQK